MPQVFHRSFNAIGRVVVFGLPLTLAGLGIGAAAFFRSGYATGADTAYEQPVPFSHQHHVSQLGIDCRYCHTSVETSAFAGIPPTKTCMNCHQQMWVGADLLAPVRESYRTDQSIPWQRIHNLPDFVYFNHSIHISKGVGCVSCHGHIDKMPLVFQTKTLLMEWCLDCHRHPEKALRPREHVFDMTWTVDKGGKDPKTGADYPTNQAELGALLKDKYHVRDALSLTSCSMCHR
jgi:hypothetical protein